MKRSAIILTLLFAAQQLYAQCAMCKAVAEEAAEEQAANINTGIIYIMIVPYIILFVIFRKKIFGLLREIRRVPQTTGQKKSD